MARFIYCVPTPQSLRANSRRLDRRLASVSRVLTELQLGAVLHLTHTRGGDVWTLSNGKFVSPGTAAMVIARADVETMGDGLFAGTSQSFRMKRSTPDDPNNEARAGRATAPG